MNKSMTYCIIERSEKPLSEFSAPDLRSLYRLTTEKRIYGERNDDFVLRIMGSKVRTGKYIGVIQLSTGSRIEILPKLAKDKKDDAKNEAKAAAVHMLRAVFHLDNAKTLDRTSLASSNKDVYELLIQIYLSELMNLLKKGLRSGYTPVEDNLGCFKGKLLINEHIHRNTAHGERFYVQFDEFGPNRPENRLIKTTVQRLLSVSVAADNRKRLRRAPMLMEGVDTSVNIDLDFASCVIDRTTADYRSLLNWSRFFLRRYSFDPFLGDADVLSMLIPAEYLFEKYTGIYLRRLFSGYSLTVFEQEKELKLAKTDTKQSYFQLIPDFVIRSNSQSRHHDNVPAVILDAKWKLPDGNRPNFNISRNDLYQLFAYARAYQAKHVWLLYPTPVGGKPGGIPKTLSLPDEVKLHIAFIDPNSLAVNDETNLLREQVHNILLN